MPVTLQEEEQQEPVSSSSYDDIDPHNFAATVRGMWPRLPESIKAKVQDQLMFPPLVEMDGYTVSLAISTSTCPPQLQTIRSIVYDCRLISYEVKRLELARFYSNHASQLRQDQKDFLAGCIAHMCPREERYEASADRVIGAAISSGGDFDAFQFFSEMIKSMIRR